MSLEKLSNINIHLYEKYDFYGGGLYGRHHFKQWCVGSDFVETH